MAQTSACANLERVTSSKVFHKVHTMTETRDTGKLYEKVSHIKDKQSTKYQSYIPSKPK